MPRTATTIQFGVPLPLGLFSNHKALGVLTDRGTVLPSEIFPTALWPDNSIKWCFVRTQVDLNKNETLHLRIAKHPAVYDPDAGDYQPVSETKTTIRVKTKNCIFELNKNRFGFLQKVTRNGETIIESGYSALTQKEFGRLEPEIESYRHHTSYSQDGPLTSELTITGALRSAADGLIARFQTALIFDINTDQVKCQLTLHNPKPARHVSGLWDLGDPNSLFFSSFDLGFKVSDISAIDWKAEKAQPWNTLAQQPLIIFQESSGGRSWDSPNHIDRNNTVPYTLNGYECRTHSTVLQAGNRASPGLRVTTRSGCVGVFIENFWQNCPKSLTIENDRINIGLFPDQFSSEFELQPGEKKTHSLYMDFSHEPNAIERIENPVEVMLNPAWIERAGVFPYFSTDISADQLHDIISEGLTGNNNFFAKREVVDEYGWRNFGDLYADHEAERSDNDKIFVSHYNNQYDPIYGFLRQYALTGNPKWFELADDLASHVTDIDIYHTRHDKDEYNGGLFWHTDHYLEAATSTHRSFSRLQKSDAYIGHAGGGGPGGQHCYTTGLLYHYLLTGNDASRLAVLELTDWVTKFYEGSGTVLSVLLSVKQRNQVGSKNIASGKYPLDRGTANYINALLDKFTLTQEQSALHQVEHIIKNTVHPLDNIEDRHLGDVEMSWFYTVFLQSLCRYLQTKEELSNLDDSFYYARDSLLHYADWMVDNEYPYLQKPEILEFPNHTWTAQDIRKVNILLFARYYSPTSSPTYSNKARELYSYITDTLSAEPTRYYTRILAILMQNDGAMPYFVNRHRDVQFDHVRYHKPSSRHNRFLAIKNVVAALLVALRSFSPKKELLWLSHRSDAAASLLRIWS